VEGFDAGDVRVPAPPVEVSDEVREKLVQLVTAIAAGRTPEENAELVAGGETPDVVVEWLERSGEREEIGAHVDLILGVLQAPAGAAA
jgi:hypothetical protein